MLLCLNILTTNWQASKFKHFCVPVYSAIVNRLNVAIMIITFVVLHFYFLFFAMISCTVLPSNWIMVIHKWFKSCFLTLDSVCRFLINRRPTLKHLSLQHSIIIRLLFFLNSKDLIWVQQALIDQFLLAFRFLSGWKQESATGEFPLKK